MSHEAWDLITTVISAIIFLAGLTGFYLVVLPVIRDRNKE